MMYQQYCARCGNPVGERSRFCAECGNNLIRPGSVTAAPPASPAPAASGSSLRRLRPIASSPSPDALSGQAEPPATANPFANYNAGANAANPFTGYDAGVNAAANPNPGYGAAANPFAGLGYGAALNQPAAPYLPGYDRTANANPIYGYGPPPDPAANPFGYGAAPNPPAFLGSPPFAPRRSWGLYALVIAPIALLAIVLIFYFALSGFSALQFGKVSSAFGNSIADPGCHFSASGSGLRGELSAAINTMCQTNSFHVVMDGKMNGQTISVSGNFKRGAGQFDATAVGVTYHGIIIGSDAYVSRDGKTWISDDTGQAHNVALFAELFDFIPSNFSDVPVDKGNEQMLGGEKAHKISVSGGGPGTIIGPGSSGDTTFWVVDNNGTRLVRHLQVNVTMSGAAANMDIEYTNFNVPVNVSAPQVSGSNAPSLGASPYGNSSAPSFQWVQPTLAP